MMLSDIEREKYNIITDEQLIESYKKGEYLALLELISRYSSIMEQKLHVKNIAESDFEDIRQELMLTFVKAINSYDDGKVVLFSTFASVCFDNSIINSIKKRNTKKNQILTQAVSLGDEENINLGEVFTNPEKIYIDQESYLDLIEKIDFHLSDFEKKVLFCFLDRKSYEQIANEFSVTVKAVDNAMQRIRRKLKTVFQK